MSDFGTTYIRAARQLIGVPWRHQGRSKQLGLDCIGLCIVAAEMAGVKLPDVSGYPRRQTGKFLKTTLHKNLEDISVTSWNTGDIGLFKETNFPVHVGVLNRGENDNCTVIHAHARRRKVVEEPLSTYGYPYAVFRVMKEEL